MAKKRKSRVHSAGFITFVKDNDQFKVLLLDHGKHISHPKGHLKKNETRKEAAIRELKEETNMEPLEMSSQPVTTIKYRIEKRSKSIDKTVYFYACIAQGDIEISEEHTRYVLLVANQARNTLTYKTDKDALKAGLEWLEKQK